MTDTQLACDWLRVLACGAAQGAPVDPRELRWCADAIEQDQPVPMRARAPWLWRWVMRRRFV